jgi:hypothetical protein
MVADPSQDSFRHKRGHRVQDRLQLVPLCRMPCQGFERQVCEHQQATHPNIISLCDLQRDSVSHSLFLESCLNGTNEIILPISIAPK